MTRSARAGRGGDCPAHGKRRPCYILPAAPGGATSTEHMHQRPIHADDAARAEQIAEVEQYRFLVRLDDALRPLLDPAASPARPRPCWAAICA